MNWLHHLFSTEGFPTVVKYGGSWEPGLIAIFVVSRGMCAAAYFIFLLAFGFFVKDWRQERIDKTLAEKHLPRVAKFYFVSVLFDFILQVTMIAAFWWPAYRFVGLLTFVSTAALLVAAIKTVVALNLCLFSKQKTQDNAEQAAEEGKAP